MPLGVVGTPHKWTRLDMPEAHFQALHFQHEEFIGMDVSVDRKMILCWLKILAEGEDIAVYLAKILHNIEHFLGSFTDA